MSGDVAEIYELIEENMKAILGFSLTRLGDVKEAEELSSEIICKLLKAAGSLKSRESFYGFMWKIAENTYVDYLRARARFRGKTEELKSDLPYEGLSVEEELERKANLNLLRRELSLLTRQYRSTTVLYYIEGNSCSEIAKKLGISTEMVKYYLFRARKIIREGMDMERILGEKSYHPVEFEVDFWGTNGGDDREYLEFKKRKIKGNILLGAYYSPVTLQEMSMEFGVAMPYLEDEVKLLEERQYLVCRNGKYLTNIPIFTKECSEAICTKMKKHIDDAADKFISLGGAAISRQYGKRFANENLMRWQIVMLCCIGALLETESQLPQLPETGAYSLVIGGGGRGIIWGKSKDEFSKEGDFTDVKGVYAGVDSTDSRGRFYAINFYRTLNGQFYQGGMEDAFAKAAEDGVEGLPFEVRRRLEEACYVREGKLNFPVYESVEWNSVWNLLSEELSVFTEFMSQTEEMAGMVMADMAPRHIKKAAEYAGRLVSRFDFIAYIAEVLFSKGWLKPVADIDKPTMCLVKTMDLASYVERR